VHGSAGHLGCAPGWTGLGVVHPAEDLGRLLAGDTLVRASPPAPAQGLYFVQAEYPEHWFHLGNEPS
jgi:tRNA U38,U39,U40 pseudouridine synthase TruA